MASYWQHSYFIDSFRSEFNENFKNSEGDSYKRAQQILEDAESRLRVGSAIVNETSDRKVDNFASALDVYMRLWTSVFDTICAFSDHREFMKMAEDMVDALQKPGRIIFLSGEWIMAERSRKDLMESLLNQTMEHLPSRKSTIIDLIKLSRNPWGTESVKKLITGKLDKDEDVLGLITLEGVEGVLLRVEMLIQSNLDQQAYKSVCALVNALVPEEMILQSYQSTSPPGTIDRLLDIFMALSAALRKQSKLFKVLKVLGLDEVNGVYMKRFGHYLNNTIYTEDNDAQKEKSSDEKATPMETEKQPPAESKDPASDKDCDTVKTKEKEKTLEEKMETDAEAARLALNESMDASSANTVDETRFQMISKGRCERLFTEAVCLKTLEVMFQWSLAGVAVKPTNTTLQTYLLSEWMDKCSSNKTRLMEDVDILMELANQTSFLYILAHQLWKRFAKEVETKCLGIFVRSLNSDINEYEVARRSKLSKTTLEKRLALGFWLLSDVVADRTSLSRECVLTSFSIHPTQERLDRIVELAKLSGLDQIEEEEEDKDEALPDEKLDKEKKAGIHCRVTLGVEEGDRKFTKSYHQRLKARTDAKESKEILSTFSLDDSFDDKMQELEKQLEEKLFTVAPTKLRTNKPREKKKARNLEGLISIRGELITEAANYNPLDVPCRSLQPDVLNLSRQLTDDLLIVISAPRWHMLSWVMAWPELHTKCADLLKDPTLRDPIEDLKYLNIDYTQFNGWSSDEEVTIFTGIEKGYEQWLLDGPDNEDAQVSENEASSGEEFDHQIDWENYDDVDLYAVPEDYKLLNGDRTVTPPPQSTEPTEEAKPDRKRKAEEESTKQEDESKVKKEDVIESKEKEEDNIESKEKDIEKETNAEGKEEEKKEEGTRKRKAEEVFKENVEDEFCNEEAAEANAKRPMDETRVVEEK